MKHRTISSLHNPIIVIVRGLVVRYGGEVGRRGEGGAGLGGVEGPADGETFRLEEGRLLGGRVEEIVEGGVCLAAVHL